MRTIEFPGATPAPNPRTLKAARLVAIGETPAMAAELVAMWFPVNERDDLAMLHDLTANRCSAASAEIRS